MIKLQSISVILLFSILIFNCIDNKDPVAGNSAQVGNTAFLQGHIYNEDKTPAEGALVYFVPSSHNPYSDGYSNMLGIKDSVLTLEDGWYGVDTLAAGYYNIYVESIKGRLCLIDSVVVTEDSQAVEPDTLKAPGSISGFIKILPGDEPDKFIVIIMGSNKFQIAGRDASFNLTGLAEGEYTVKFFSTLDRYSNLDTSFTVTAGENTVLPDSIVIPLKIPIPTGLKLDYDTLKQIVSLSWDRMDTAKVKGYNLYRKQTDSFEIKINSEPIKDTIIADSSLSETDIYEYRISAVSLNDDDGTRGAVLKINFENRLKRAERAAAFGARIAHSSVVFNDKLWIIGGKTGNNILMNDVWSSNDGVNWTKATDSAAFSIRKFHASVVFNNRMWVIGGYNYNEGEKNDVWYTTDGQNWIQATDSASFSPRYLHGCVVFNSQIWIIGGIASISGGFADVWYSPDGISWERAADSIEAAARIGIGVTVFNDKIWIIGGSYQNRRYNDVWYTNNGVDWLQATDSTSFTKRYYHSIVADDSIFWIFGGIGNGTDGLTDGWHSYNGIDWIQFNTPPNFTKKRNHTSIAYDGKIWIIGQAYGEDRTDIWYLE